MAALRNEVAIHIDGGQDELLNLLSWLQRDEALRGLVSLPTTRTTPGQMGDIYDVLVVAVGAGGIAPALIRSLSVYLPNRRSDLKITVTRSDGSSTIVDAQRIKAPEVIEELRKLVDGEPGDLD